MKLKQNISQKIYFKKELLFKENLLNEFIFYIKKYIIV
jgi:hypothetical protein